jgi:hypothetical protein
MLGFKSFWSAAVTIAGIELMPRSGRANCHHRQARCPARQFYSLAVQRPSYLWNCSAMEVCERTRFRPSPNDYRMAASEWDPIGLDRPSAPTPRASCTYEVQFTCHQNVNPRWVPNTHASGTCLKEKAPGLPIYCTFGWIFIQGATCSP